MFVQIPGGISNGGCQAVAAAMGAIGGHEDVISRKSFLHLAESTGIIDIAFRRYRTVAVVSDAARTAGSDWLGSFISTPVSRTASFGSMTLPLILDELKVDLTDGRSFDERVEDALAHNVSTGGAASCMRRPSADPYACTHEANIALHGSLLTFFEHGLSEFKDLPTVLRHLLLFDQWSMVWSPSPYRCLPPFLPLRPTPPAPHFVVP